jgi:DNA-binding transcriptional regulator YiaG
MTPAEFRAARHAIGLSAEGMARALKVSSGRTVRRWEAGDRDIPGPAIVAIGFMLKAKGLPPPRGDE